MGQFPLPLPAKKAGQIGVNQFPVLRLGAYHQEVIGVPIASVPRLSGKSHWVKPLSHKGHLVTEIYKILHVWIERGGFAFLHYGRR